MKNILLSIFMLNLLLACAKNDLIVLIPDSDGQVGELLVTNKEGTQRITQAYMAVEVSNQDKVIESPKELDKTEVNKTFASAMAANPQKSKHFILYFNSASTELTDESLTIIATIIKEIAERRVADIFIIGHTDTQAATDFNAQLALKRAKKVEKIFQDKGFKKGGNSSFKGQQVRIHVTSHGEGKLLISTEDNVNEPRNRRVEVVIH